jgi:hypothetical protein
VMTISGPRAWAGLPTNLGSLPGPSANTWADRLAGGTAASAPRRCADDAPERVSRRRTCPRAVLVRPWCGGRRRGADQLVSPPGQ